MPDGELARLEALLRIAPLPMAAVRPDGWVLFANDHAFALFGLRREDNPQQDTVEFFSDPADYARMIADRRAGAIEPRELQMKKADGTPIRVLVSSEMAVVGGEQLVISGLQDVTGLRLAEEALRRSEQRFRALIQNTADVISVLDPKGVILYNSPTAIRTFGFAEDEAIGTQSLDFVHPDDREAVLRAGAAMLAKPGTVARYECRVRHKDGHYLFVEAAVTNLVDDPAVGGLVVNYWDVTERAQAREAIEASEHRCRALFEAGEDIITCFDDQAVITFSSPSTARVLGYEPEELVGQDGWQFIRPEDVPGLRSVIRECLSEPRRQERISFRVRHKDGHDVWVEGVCSNLYDDEAVGALVVNYRDVTERMRDQEELNLMQWASLAVAAAADLRSGLDLVLERICGVTGWGAGEVWTPSAGGTLLECTAAWSVSNEALAGFIRNSEGMTFAPGVGLPGIAWSTGKPLWSRDVSGDPNCARSAYAQEAGLKAGVAVPVLAGDEAVAVMAFFMFEAREEDERFVCLVSAVAAQLGALVRRKRAEEALQQSEERFRSLIENSGDMITLVDPEGNIVYASPSIRRELGYSDREFAGHPAADFGHPDDQPNLLDCMSLAIGSPGSPVRTEFRVHHKDGHWLWAEANLTAFDRGPENRGTVFNYRDITERRRLEEALRLSEESFRGVADGSAQGIIIAQNSRVAYANPAIAEIVGCLREELVGLTTEEANRFVHPDDKEAVRTRGANRVRGSPEPVSAQYRIIRQDDGAVRWIEVYGTTIQFHGERSLLSVVVDITERKQSEEMLRRLSRVVEQTADEVLVTDVQGTILYANPAAERATGYTAEELLGKNPSILGAGEMPARFFKRLWETILAGRTFRGEFVNRRKDGTRYYEEKVITPIRGEGGEIVQFVSTGRDVTERKQAEETIRHMAYHDTLTGLPNRVLFVDRATIAIAQAKRAGGKLAVLFLDLDRLKYVNDTLGHDKGDEVIKEAGLDVWNTIRDGDTVARMGGDEYAILVTDLADTRAAEAVAGRIVEVVGRPRSLSGQDVFVTASVGIAMYPDDGTDAGVLLKSADMAMYAAKERGGDGYEVYSHLMGVRVRARLGLENDLRLAIESGGLEVHYQPQVSVATGEVTGVEALARWNHPDRGPISPAEFVPVAEETGLIAPLRRFVISTAMDQLTAWRDEGLAQFRMAINLSAACLRLSDLTENIRTVLSDPRVEPARVQFEITESMALADPEAAMETLAAIRDMGATIALDDFGTGYSSFENLRRLPIDVIKLDIALVRDIGKDPAAGAIATAVLSMARELGLRVVAEGVETEEQLEALRQRGCDDYQGFLFSKALPADEVTALLRKGNGARKTRRRKPGE